MMLAIAGGLALAQSAPEAPTTDITDTAGGGLSQRPGPVPSDAFRTTPAGIPYRRLFRDTHTPFRESHELEMYSPVTGEGDVGLGYRGPAAGFRTGLGLREPMPLTGSESASAGLDLFGVNLDFRLSGRHGINLLQRGFEPEDADLKVGPLYFKLRALSAGVLMSDNVNATETDRESGAIAIARLSASVVAQLTETLRLSVSGSLIWLPFKGKVGVTSSSGALDFDIANSSDNGASAQISQEGRIGEWDWFVADTFTVYFPGELFGSYTYDNVLFEGASFTEVDQAGRYRYGNYGATRPLDHDSRTDARQDFSLDQREYINRFDIAAQRVYPGRLRVRLHAYREDLWYNQSYRGLPSYREGAGLFAISQRENLRFKPYLRYNIDKTEFQNAPNQTLVFGLRGPITDQLELDTYAGVFHQGDSGQNTFLAGLRLDHQAGPYTLESLFVGREILDYYYTTEAIDRATYHLHQVLGPRFFADAFASFEIHSALDNSGAEREEFRAGARLTALPGPRSIARLGYVYTRATSNSADFLFPADEQFGTDRVVEGNSADYTTHTVHFDFRYHFTDTFFAQLNYIFRDISSSIPGDSYYENLLLMSLTKYFY